MARARCVFRERDITRAVRAVTKAGVPVARVEIEKDGKIILVTGNPGQVPERNELDDWMKKHADTVERH